MVEFDSARAVLHTELQLQYGCRPQAQEAPLKSAMSAAWQGVSMVYLC